MKLTLIVLVAITLLLSTSSSVALQRKGSVDPKRKTKTAHSTLSYKKDVFPIIKMNCLPCHTEDQMNQSELYMETYADLIHGGKHGPPIVTGKADSSLMIKKLVPPPPFGDPMPMRRKTPLSADTIDIIKNWINQGAKNN